MSKTVLHRITATDNNQENDVILVIVETCCNNSLLSISNDTGLTFTQRLSYASQTSYEAQAQTIWEYYAIATLPLDSDNITVVAHRCCCSVWGMQALAISGADTSTIFDQDPSVPATVSCPGPDCGDCTASFTHGTCSTSIHTSTQDFVIASIPINDAGPCGPHYPNGSVPGFTNITNQ
ncbi:hypothetical protein E6H34_04790 [Candidatus Bathyarchaeota archaeon]|nr:MAG: hypothetical protein E6H34_04790 [Candidatus Bathyarchaeota archaeon]